MSVVMVVMVAHGYGIQDRQPSINVTTDHIIYRRDATLASISHLPNDTSVNGNGISEVT